MRSLDQMDTLQIELTNACVLTCSNCTRFCGHQKPFYLTEEQFHTALDSLVDFPHMVGFMGGEPLLHPRFAEFCAYALERIPRDRLGLWSVFPKGKEHHREVIAKTFGQVFLNDHTRDDIKHGPILVAIEEHIKNDADLFRIVDKCWVQNSWSASINSKGAFFCEVAGALSLLFEGSDGWKVEPGWWKRTPKDFGPQMEEFCRKCGCALPLVRRASVDNRDDISPGNLERLKKVGSRKLDKGQYVVSEFQMDPGLVRQMYPDQVYKEIEFRNKIAGKYGMFLAVNDRGFMEPFLLSGGVPEPKKPLFEIYRERFEQPKPRIVQMSAHCSSMSRIQ